MTPKQHKWYLREWGRAFKAHWAGVKGGEVLAKPGRPDSQVRDQVISAARARVVRRGGGQLTADDVRHACHILAVGRDLSCWNLTNKQIDLVVAKFRSLASDCDIASTMALDQAATEPSRRAAPGGLPDSDRKRTLWSLEHSDLSSDYIAKISRDKFGTANYRSLGDAQLHQLLITIKARAAAQAIAGTKRVNLAATI